MPRQKYMKSIPGYERLYKITQGGVVYNRKGRMKSFTDKEGYVRQTLTKNGEKKTHKVHRLVLQTFVGDGTGMEADHLNGIRNDNRLKNLEWVTAETNNHRKVIRIYGVLKSVDKRGKKRGQLKMAM